MKAITYYCRQCCRSPRHLFTLLANIKVSMLSFSTSSLCLLWSVVLPPSDSHLNFIKASSSINHIQQPWQNILLSHSQACVSNRHAADDKTLISIVSVGGTAGYLRTRSTPSLVAGIGLGASYALAGQFIT